jgi:tetratricopeptide (TPR) repeat protein
VSNVGGQVQTRGGSFDEGLANGHRLLETNPGVALQQAQALLRSRVDPRAFELAAAALRRLGSAADAEQAELSGIKASFADQQLDRAAVAGRDGDIAQSQSIIERFLQQQPGNLLALTLAAELDIDRWRLEAAEKRLRVVLERAPTFLRAIMLLGKCLSSQGRLKEAIAVVEGVVQRKPNNLVALRNLAQLDAEANDHEKAASTYGRILDLEPRLLDMWILYAQHLRMVGRKEESMAAFRRALEIDPDSGAAWWALVYYFPSAITHGDIEAMHRGLAERSDSAVDGGPLHIALSIVEEGRGNYPEAFRHVDEGKKLRHEANPYDAAAESIRIDELIRTLTSDRFAERRSAGWPDKSPIFIVGMPRSGTTLLERILSRHSAIEACGELPIMPRLEKRLQHGGEESYAGPVASMSDEELSQLGKWYVERSLDYRTSGKPRFIDKLNLNWSRSGLIRLMLPNARIIDLRRDVLDCCWSNFKMMFAEGHLAANDQRDIARFYRDYVRMIDAIDEAFPGGILKVRYEELVDDVEGQTRRILDFLGLDYEPACVDFHLSTEAVATPSSEQVRRPINRDSIGSSLPYREWLGPMIEELGELADQ